MAANHNHTPAFLGGDLPEEQRTAYQEGHDADFLAKKTDVKHDHDPHRPNSAGSRGSDPEKNDSNERSEATSVNVPVTISAASRDLEKAAAEPTTAVEEQDPNVVTWESDDDPANPMNWSAELKWGNIAVLSALTFLTPLASSMFAPGVPQLMREFESDSSTMATFVVSIYVLGFAVGPLVIAPASELYGRLYVYHITTVGFIVFTIACALAPSLGSLIAFRFLQGCWGVTPVTIGGGTIADLMAPEKRGGAMAIWAMGPLLGPGACCSDGQR